MARKQTETVAPTLANMSFKQLDDTARNGIAVTFAKAQVAIITIEHQSNDAKQAALMNAADASPRITADDFKTLRPSIQVALLNSGKYSTPDAANTAASDYKVNLIGLTNRLRPGDDETAKSADLRKALNPEPGEAPTAYRKRVRPILAKLGVLPDDKRQPKTGTNKSGEGEDKGEGKSKGVTGATRKELSVALAQGSEPLALAFEAIAAAPRHVQTAFLAMYRDVIEPMLDTPAKT